MTKPAWKERLDASLESFEENILGAGGVKKDVALIVVSGVALVVSLAAPDAFPVDPAWVAIVLCGVPILCEAFVGLVTRFDIKADVLVSMALIASVAIGEYFAAGEVAAIMQLGALLEDLTVARARSGIEKLVELTPRTARVVEGGQERTVAAEEVLVGQTVRVLPGETVPVDGVITIGQTSIDQSVMTGEPIPVDKAEGDEVRSGTVNRFGAFDMRATRVGEDSSLARMVALVQSADAGKAKIVRLADRWATWIVVAALTAAICAWVFTGEIIRAVTVLVVFCPCALVLATPTAIMAAIGNVTKYGVLVREGDALERLSKVRRVMFDKTGTLTHGAPEVVAVEVESDAGAVSADELLRMAAAAEQRSEHPLGRAIVAGWREREGGGDLGKVDGFSMTPGRGVEAVVDGHKVLVGNAEMMRKAGVEGFADDAGADYVARGCTLSFVAVDGIARGYIALADTVRETSRAAVAGIEAAGPATVMATGDQEAAAFYIAGQVGVGAVLANCFPEDKMAAIERFEAAGEPVCMVGDGINDAPALKRATVGVAMGGVGSDIAVDAADMVLVRDDIAALPHVIALSRRMMFTIKCNLTFSMTLNFVAVALALAGLMGPVVGALVHNVGSVAVICNSALLLRWKAKRQDSSVGSKGSAQQPAMTLASSPEA